MLVIVNGAFRSGSTWLNHIVRTMVLHSDIPEEYQNVPEWEKGTSIHPEKLADFLKNVDYQHTNYISKNHFGKTSYRNLLLSYKNVYILDIERDIRDTITSSYYYYRRRREYHGTFEKFYWQRGRWIANYLRKYHSIWQCDSPNIYVSSFERLKTDFIAEVEKIGNFLGFTLSESDINRIKKETSIEKLRKRINEENRPEEERFFRKGVVGDWEGRFNDKMLRNIDKIQKQGMGIIEKIVLRLTYPWPKKKQKLQGTGCMPLEHDGNK